MDYDAMGVGNHDFDDGRDGLLPFAQEAGFPLLAANLNVSAFPEIDAWIDSATILDVQGKFIYETNWSKLISNTWCKRMCLISIYLALTLYTCSLSCEHHISKYWRPILPYVFKNNMNQCGN